MAAACKGGGFGLALGCYRVLRLGCYGWGVRAGVSGLKYIRLACCSFRLCAAAFAASAW